MAVNSTASKKEYKQSKTQSSRKDKFFSENKVTTIILILVFIVFAVSLLGVSGAFNISEIVVEGNVNLSEEQIISFSEIEKGTNLFAISKNGIVQKIKENSYVDGVQVKRCFPNKVKLIVEERQAKYALPLANSYVYIDGQGYVLQISNQPPSVPILLGFITDLSNVKENNRLEEMDLAKINVVIKIMETAAHHSLENLITKIDISNEENYAIYFDTEGKIAYLGNGTELNTRFLYIKGILKEQQGKTGKIFVGMDLNWEYAYFSEEPI